MNEQQTQLLGEIHGMVKSMKETQERQASAIERVDGRIDKLDDRLRTVEQRSAQVGAVSGGAMAIGVALIVEALKTWVGKGTPHP